MDHDVGINFGIQRKSLHAVKIRACSRCGAPGVYLSHPSIQQGWPGCYDASLPANASTPVGNTCPNCGKPRPRDQDLGEIEADKPLWLWKTILVVKWLLINFKRFRKGALQ